jgi:hypothetical protein
MLLDSPRLWFSVSKITARMSAGNISFALMMVIESGGVRWSICGGLKVESVCLLDTSDNCHEARNNQI